MSPNLLWLEFKDVRGSGTSCVEAGEKGSATPVGWGRGMKTRFTPHARCIHRGGTTRMGPLRGCSGPTELVSLEEPEGKREGPGAHSVVVVEWMVLLTH